MPPILDGANTTAQWYYYDNYPSGTVFPSLEKFCLHTTETMGWPGYRGGAAAPNATYHPRLRAIRQHFPNNVSSRALVDPAGTTVRENRDRVFQLEIVAYSDYALARSVGGLWIGDLTDEHYDDLAKMMRQLNRELGLPLTDTVTWREGQKTYVSGVRLSGPAFDAYRGILGHVHVSGNSHWDPGGFRMSRLRPKLVTAPQPPEDDLPTPAEVWNHRLADPHDDQPESAGNLLRFARIDAYHAWQKAVEVEKDLAALAAEVAKLKPPAPPTP